MVTIPLTKAFLATVNPPPTLVSPNTVKIPPRKVFSVTVKLVPTVTPRPTVKPRPTSRLFVIVTIPAI